MSKFFFLLPSSDIPSNNSSMTIVTFIPSCIRWSLSQIMFRSVIFSKHFMNSLCNLIILITRERQFCFNWLHNMQCYDVEDRKITSSLTLVKALLFAYFVLLISHSRYTYILYMLNRFLLWERKYHLLWLFIILYWPMKLSLHLSDNNCFLLYLQTATVRVKRIFKGFNIINGRKKIAIHGLGNVQVNILFLNLLQ